MYYTLIYKNLSSSQKNSIKTFINLQFKNISNIDFGLEPNTIIILNYENNKIIGCVCLINNSDLKNKLGHNDNLLSYYDFQNKKGLFLYNLCVDTEYRNKKIGNQLINLANKLAKDVNIEYIHTHAENEISKLIFIKNNFTEIKTFISNKNTQTTLMTIYIE